MFDFARHAVRKLDPYRSSAVVEDKLSALRHRLRRGAQNRRLAFAGGAAAAVAVAAVVVVVLARPRPAVAPSQRVASASVARAAAMPSPELALADGSRVRGEPGAQVVVVDASSESVELRLDHGRAHIYASAAPRPFVVDAGAARLLSYGGELVATRRGEHVHVEVLHGQVSARWSTGEATLRAGQEGSFPARAPPPRAPEPAKAPPRARRTLELAPAEHAPAHAPAASAPTLEQADLARREGRTDEAIALLRLVAASDDPQRAVAGFTLGKLLHRAGDHGEAAAAFAAARAQGLGALEEDAWVREASSWHAAGEVARARATLEAYLRQFPEGHRRAEGLAKLRALAGASRVP